MSDYDPFRSLKPSLVPDNEKASSRIKSNEKHGVTEVSFSTLMNGGGHIKPKKDFTIKKAKNDAFVIPDFAQTVLHPQLIKLKTDQSIFNRSSENTLQLNSIESSKERTDRPIDKEDNQRDETSEVGVYNPLNNSDPTNDPTPEPEPGRESKPITPSKSCPDCAMVITDQNPENMTCLNPNRKSKCLLDTLKA